MTREARSVSDRSSVGSRTSLATSRRSPPKPARRNAPEPRSDMHTPRKRGETSPAFLYDRHISPEFISERLPAFQSPDWSVGLSEADRRVLSRFVNRVRSRFFRRVSVSHSRVIEARRRLGRLSLGGRVTASGTAGREPRSFPFACAPAYFEQHTRRSRVHFVRDGSGRGGIRTTVGRARFAARDLPDSNPTCRFHGSLRSPENGRGGIRTHDHRMAPPAGPPGLEVRRSVQLSYAPSHVHYPRRAKAAGFVP